MIPRQQSMDDNPLALDTLRGKDEIAIPSYLSIFYILLLDPMSGFQNAVPWALGLAWYFQLTLLKPIIARRLWAVIYTNLRQMDDVLASMELWESRSCQKVNGHSNGEDTMTRLRSFLEAMESLDLMDKIHELKGLSNHLNIVTKRLIRSQPLLAMDLIFRNFLPNLYLYVVPQGVLSITTASELDDVKSIVDDLESTATRLDSPRWLLDINLRQWETSDDARKSMDKMEEITTDIHSMVKILRKKADLPDFGSVAVVSYWRLGVSATPDEEIRLRPEHSPMDSRLRRRTVRQVDERQFGWSYQMEPVEVNDVEENPAYRGICKLCIKFETKDRTEIAYGTGWLINNSTVVTAAHNLYSPLDKSYAFEVKVQVGVTKGSKNVEMRWGHSVAIRWGFYAVGKRQNDMAMIKLGPPFDNVVPILCRNAPLVETESRFLRVVGYPGNRGGAGEHQGRIMHVSEGAHAGWDLKSTDYIFRHHLDTDNGHSGCPLLEVGDDGDVKAIAIHAGDSGVVDKGWNEAAPLGHNGNHIEAFAESFRMMEDGDEARHIPGSRIEEVQGKIPGLKKVTIPL